MKIKYHKQIVDLLYEEWDLGKKRSKALGKTCAWIYWFEIMGDIEKIIIEKDNKKVIGVCGYSKWNSNKYLFRKKIYRLLAKILMNSPLIKNKRAITEYNNAYEYLPKELENYFEGEITILIVEKKNRGKKLGKKLLNQVFELAKKDNIKNIQISTDESCNYNFYISMGCNKVYETSIALGEPNKESGIYIEKGYIYVKKLDS